jgi:predicted MPP superfamily phosphohydrolase
VKRLVVFGVGRRKLIIGLLVLAFLVDAFIYEPFHPVLQTYHVAIPGLPKEADGFRVVQLSDLHRNIGFYDRTLRRGVELANSTHADVAVVTGDLVSLTAANATPCCRILKGLKTKYGTYAVPGNHEYWTDAPTVCRAITDSGITLLINRNARLANGLRLVGVDDEWSGMPDEDAAFEGIAGRDPRIVLCHEPTTIRRFANRPGLVLCGHTHGGVLNIPVLVHVFARFAHCGGYVSGWYERGPSLMYVNRGIGSVFPPLRFRSRPEVTLFILHPAKAARPYVIGDHAEP